MAHKTRRDGSPYLHGESSPIHDEFYSVTIMDAVIAINSDPDLDAVQKSQAIKHLAGLKGQTLTDFLNQTYKKAYGSDVNTKTPLAEFIEKIVERKRKENRR